MTTVFRNGRFFVGGAESHTLDHPFSHCMLVTNDLIEYIGGESDHAVTKAIKNGALASDMQGRVVIPGFIDGHMHFLLLGLALRKLDLGTCKNMDDISSTIKSYAKANPASPRILCHGWEQPATNGIALASMLDPLDPRPIFIDAKDLHSTWCNLAALKELDIESMEDPTGGKSTATSREGPPGCRAKRPSLRLFSPILFE